MVPLRKLLQIGFVASFGAPILYGCYIVATTLVNSRMLDTPLLIMALGSALLFSFVTTQALVLVAVGVFRLLHISSVNAALVSVSVLVGLSALVAIKVGLGQAGIFFTLALANVLIFILLARRSIPSQQI